MKNLVPILSTISLVIAFAFAEKANADASLVLYLTFWADKNQ